MNLIGILCALAAACMWGGGDFCGGLATRKTSPFHALALSALVGLSIVLACAVLWREPLPSSASVLWAVLGGLAGSVGIAALYRALSLGFAATVAPTSAVVAAALPVGFGVLTQGLPQAAQLAGFALALPGIWLVAQHAASGQGVSRQGLGLACLAGVGFGGFFVLIAQVEAGRVFLPLGVARCVSLLTALLLIRLRRMGLPSLTSSPPALLAGVLDAGGNIGYLLAKQLVRLDVAAVLSSLYPVTTVLLAGIILEERVSPRQWLGVTLCLAAVVLITL